MIDDHPMECRAMTLFRSGQSVEASALQEEFLAGVKASGEDYCSCEHACSLHGQCVECVIVHRGHGDHLPNCFRNMVNRRLAGLSALTEHTVNQSK